MADAAPNMSAPFNALIQSNQQAAQNPLTVAAQAAQTQTALTNSQTAGLQLNDEQLANAQNHVAYRINAITPLLAKGNGVTTNDIVNRINNLVYETRGAFSANEAAHTITDELPPSPNGDPDAPNPAAAKYLQMQAMRLQDMNSRIATARGEPVTVQTGGGSQFGTRNSFSGAFQPQGGQNGYVPNQTSPAERIAPATVTDANGNTTQTTVGQRAAAAGMDPVSGLPLPGQATGGIPASAPSFGAGLDALNKDRLAASDTMQGLQPLLKALPLAQQLGATGSGPGTKPYADAKAFLISQGVIKPDANVDIRNELDKYLNQAVAKSPLSGRSDMGTIVAQASNPNTTSQTNAATVGLIKNAIVQTRLGLAGPLAFNDNPSSYPAYKGGFIQKQDQSAYGLDLEPDGGRATVQKMARLPLSSPARTRFFESLKAAKMVGVGAGQ